MVEHVCTRIAPAIVCLCILTAQLTGCSAGYYWQAAAGQLRVVNNREPVDKLLAEPDLSAQLKQRLLLSQAVLQFAHQELKLPDNGSYTSYYDTGHPYIVWNVFAAPEFSLQPQSWCFLVAGCVTYRGYFDPDKANNYAAKLATDGSDVYVGGVAAYSTLGRFEDPLLNTMLPLTDSEFIGLLVHELAHQLLYIKDDSAFNEGFATAVEQLGVARWRAEHDLPMDPADSQTMALQRQQVSELFAETRSRLASLYVEDIPDKQKRPVKAAVLTSLGDAYFELVAQWQAAGWQSRPYEVLILQGLNNASLGALATYADYVPAFRQIYLGCAESLECFYTQSKQLGDLDTKERDEALQSLLADAAASRYEPRR
jgi:predicted aminopeptidase